MRNKHQPVRCTTSSVCCNLPAASSLPGFTCTSVIFFSVDGFLARRRSRRHSRQKARTLLSVNAMWQAFYTHLLPLHVSCPALATIFNDVLSRWNLESNDFAKTVVANVYTIKLRAESTRDTHDAFELTELTAGFSGSITRAPHASVPEIPERSRTPLRFCVLGSLSVNTLSEVRSVADRFAPSPANSRFSQVDYWYFWSTFLYEVRILLWVY